MACGCGGAKRAGMEYRVEYPGTDKPAETVPDMATARLRRAAHAGGRVLITPVPKKA